MNVVKSFEELVDFLLRVVELEYKLQFQGFVTCSFPEILLHKSNILFATLFGCPLECIVHKWLLHNMLLTVYLYGCVNCSIRGCLWVVLAVSLK